MTDPDPKLVADVPRLYALAARKHRIHYWSKAPAPARLLVDPTGTLSWDWLAEVPAAMLAHAEGAWGWENVAQVELPDGSLLIAGNEPGGLRA